MTAAQSLLLIFGMAAVTYFSRFSPFALLHGRSLNPWLTRWLELVPPAVLAALLAPELLLSTTAGTPTLYLCTQNALLLATLPSMLTAWLTKSFFGTVMVGMGAVALLRLLA